MNEDLKQLAHLHDENIELNSLKEILAKKYGHLNWAQIKNKNRKGELDVSDLIAFCDEANRLFYKKEIERLKGERGWISVKNNKIPEKLEDFLVLFDNGEIRRLLEDDPPFACITHYMPLPEPPKQ